MAPFHHLWLQARSDGVSGHIGDYCLEHQAAEAGRFQTGENARINYAYQGMANLDSYYDEVHMDESIQERVSSCILARVNAREQLVLINLLM